VTTEDFWAERASHQVIRAAGTGKFNPLLHPRGPDGRFIKKNGWVRWLEKGKWRTGVVTHISPTDGSVTVKVAVKNPASLPEGADPETTFQKDGKTVEKVFAEPGKFLYAAEAPKGADTKASLAETLPSPASKEEKGWVKKGGQGGSNLGGKFAVPESEGTGEVYVKELATVRVQEEVAAAKLYELAGVPVPKLHQRSLQSNPTKSRIGSEIVPGDLTSIQEHLNDPEVMGKVRSGFVLDAWLANWDVIGLSYDNIVVDSDGVPWRIDVGGSLRYRAMGSPKGSAFGPEVGELETMRTKNSKGKVVYAGLTDEEMRDGAERLAAISPVDVSRILDEAGLTGASKKELLDTLLARRADILAKTGVEDPYKDVTLDAEGVFSSILPEGAVPDSVGKASSDAIAKALDADQSLPGLRLSDGMDVSVGDFVHHLTKGKMAQVTALLPSMGKHGSVEVEDEDGKTWRWAVGKLVSDTQKSLDEAYADIPLADGTTPKIGMRVTSSGKSPVTGKIVSIDRKRKWVTIAPDDGSANKVRTASTTSLAGEAEIPEPEVPEVPAGFTPSPKFEQSYASLSSGYSKRNEATIMARLHKAMVEAGVGAQYPDLQQAAKDAAAAMDVTWDNNDYYSHPTPESMDALADALKNLIERVARDNGFDQEDIWSNGFDTWSKEWKHDLRKAYPASVLKDGAQMFAGLIQKRNSEGTPIGFATLPADIDVRTFTETVHAVRNLSYGVVDPDMSDSLNRVMNDPDVLTPDLLSYIQEILPSASTDYETPWGTTISLGRLSKYEADLLVSKIESVKERWPADVTVPVDLTDPKLADVRQDMEEAVALYSIARVTATGLKNSTAFPGAQLMLEYGQVVQNSPNLSLMDKMILTRLGQSGGVNKSEMGKVMKILQSPKIGDKPVTLDMLPATILDRAYPSVAATRFLDKVWLASAGGRDNVVSEITDAMKTTSLDTLLKQHTGGAGAYLSSLHLKASTFGVDKLSDTELASLYSAFRNAAGGSTGAIPGQYKPMLDSLVADIDWDEISKGSKKVVAARVEAIRLAVAQSFGGQIIPLANGESASVKYMQVYSAGGTVKHAAKSGYQTDGAVLAAQTKTLLEYIQQNVSSPPKMAMPPSKVESDPVQQTTFDHLLWYYTAMSASHYATIEYSKHLKIAEKLLNGTLTETEARAAMDAAVEDLTMSPSVKKILQIDPFTKNLGVAPDTAASSSGTLKENPLFPSELLGKMDDKIAELRDKKAAGITAPGDDDLPDPADHKPKVPVYDTDGALDAMSARGEFEGASEVTVGSALGQVVAGENGEMTRVHFDSDAIDQHKIVIARGEDEHGKPYVRATFVMTGAAMAAFSDSHASKTGVPEAPKAKVESEDPIDAEIKSIETMQAGSLEAGAFVTDDAPSLDAVSEANPGYVHVVLGADGEPALATVNNPKTQPPNGVAVGYADTPDGKMVRVLHKNLDGDFVEALITPPTTDDKSGYTYKWLGSTEKEEIYKKQWASSGGGYGSGSVPSMYLTEDAKVEGWSFADRVGLYHKRGSDGKILIADPTNPDSRTMSLVEYGDDSTMKSGGGDYSQSIATKSVYHLDQDSGTRVDAFLSTSLTGDTVAEGKSKSTIAGHVAINIPIPDGLTPEQQQEFLARELSKGLQRMGIDKDKQRAPKVEDMRAVAVRSLYRTFVDPTGSILEGDADIEELLAKAAKKIKQRFADDVPAGWEFDLNRDIVLYKKSDGTIEPRWSPEMTEMLVRKSKAATFSSYSKQYDPDKIIDRITAFLDPKPGNGGFMSSSERVMHGITVKGQSTESDMNKPHSGEGTYFTRRTTETSPLNTGSALVTYIRPSAILSQLSIWGNPGDAWGRRTSSALNTAYGTGSGSNGGYEILTKSSASPDDIAFFVVSPGVIAALKSRGVTEIHGRPIDEILVSQNDSKRIKELTKSLQAVTAQTSDYTSMDEASVIRGAFGKPKNPDGGVKASTEFTRFSVADAAPAAPAPAEPTQPVTPPAATTAMKVGDAVGSPKEIADAPEGTVIVMKTSSPIAPVGKSYKKVGGKWQMLKDDGSLDTYTSSNEAIGGYTANLGSNSLNAYWAEIPSTKAPSAPSAKTPDSGYVESVEALNDAPVGSKAMLQTPQTTTGIQVPGLTLTKNADGTWIATYPGTTKETPMEADFLGQYIGKTEGMTLQWIPDDGEAAA